MDIKVSTINNSEDCYDNWFGFWMNFDISDSLRFQSAVDGPHIVIKLVLSEFNRFSDLPVCYLLRTS
ncbi:hypothetical protein Tco_0560146, partial [Tanacetum coccineum]